MREKKTNDAHTNKSKLFELDQVIGDHIYTRLIGGTNEAIKCQ